MGASWSKSSWFQSSSTNDGSKDKNQHTPYQAKIDPRRLASQYVYSRRGSMYFDEDGDLAHEFYEEVREENSQITYMMQKLSNLRPQGNVYYKNPRLHVDFPIPMFST